MKTYCHKEEAFQRLKKLVEEYRAGQHSVLPPERELAVKLNISRMTLRKALEMAAMEGIIQRENKTTFIRQSDLSKCGRILFVTTGYHGTIVIPVLERIFLKLQAELRNYHYGTPTASAPILHRWD